MTIDIKTHSFIHASVSDKQDEYNQEFVVSQLIVWSFLQTNIMISPDLVILFELITVTGCFCAFIGGTQGNPFSPVFFMFKLANIKCLLQNEN